MTSTLTSTFSSLLLRPQLPENSPTQGDKQVCFHDGTAEIATMTEAVKYRKPPPCFLKKSLLQDFTTSFQFRSRSKISRLLHDKMYYLWHIHCAKVFNHLLIEAV